MTVCGLVRLDGSDARRATLTAMLAASERGLPAARAVHLDGPFGVVTAPTAPALPMPPVVADRDGLVVVVVGATASTDSARRLAAEFRAQGERCLLGAGVGLTMVWDPDRRRFFASRGACAPEEVLTWSDGQTFAFGTQPAHLVGAGLPRVTSIGSIGRPPPGTRTTSVRRLVRGDQLSVTVTGSRPRRGRRTLRLVRPLGEPAG